MEGSSPSTVISRSLSIRRLSLPTCSNGDPPIRELLECSEAAAMCVPAAHGHSVLPARTGGGRRGVRRGPKPCGRCRDGAGGESCRRRPGSGCRRRRCGGPRALRGPGERQAVRGGCPSVRAARFLRWTSRRSWHRRLCSGSWPSRPTSAISWHCAARWASRSWLRERASKSWGKSWGSDQDRSRGLVRGNEPGANGPSTCPAPQSYRRTFTPPTRQSDRGRGRP